MGKLNIRSNLLDRAIEWVAPVSAARRFQARATLAISEAFAGSSKSRRSLSTFAPKEQSANSALLFEVDTLRNRSQDMLRNSPLAVGAVGTTVQNVVGMGLQLQSRIDFKTLGMTEEQAQEWQDDAERKFHFWAESQECDLARRLNFAQIQELSFRKVLEDGDLLIPMPRLKRPGSPYTLKLQLIEAARVCNKNHAPDNATLFMGVRIDEATGAPIEYHVASRHPQELYTSTPVTWKVVPAFGKLTGERLVLHPYKMLRPGQTRGIPFLSPVIETLKQLTRYTENEIMASVVSSLFTVFVKNEQGGVGRVFGSMQGDAAVDAAVSSSDKDKKLGNGAVVGLGAGQSVEIANPGRPNTAFDPFMKAVLQHIGAALGIPFEILILHFSASYSASRVSLELAWRFFGGWRKWLADTVCQPVYGAFLAEAVSTGDIAAPGFFGSPIVRAAYSGAVWNGEATPQVDPQKEVEAAKLRVETGFSTMDEETVRLTGGDFDQNLPRIARERGKLKEIGMWQSAEDKAKAAAPVALPQDKKEPPNPEKPEKGDEENKGDQEDENEDS